MTMAFGLKALHKFESWLSLSYQLQLSIISLPMH